MKVLIVEDEPAIADAVRRGLEGEGIAVDVMQDGVDGLWAATENAYDAVVLDLMLPGISGRDVLVGMRERGVWTPVLVLTAREGDEVQVGAFDRGPTTSWPSPSRSTSSWPGCVRWCAVAPRSGRSSCRWVTCASSRRAAG